MKHRHVKQVRKPERLQADALGQAARSVSSSADVSCRQMHFIRTASDSSARLWSDEPRCSGVRPRSRLKLSGDDHRAGQEQDKRHQDAAMSAQANSHRTPPSRPAKPLIVVFEKQNLLFVFMVHCVVQ